MVKVAILGFGTVGSGVWEVLTENSSLIAARSGQEIQVKYVLDLREFAGQPVEKVLVHDFDIIVKDPEVDVVVETMGGIGAAYTFTKAALEAGKQVVTSNKALVAKYGPELLAIARRQNVKFLFEASCGGGIPIIRTIETSLTADRIEEVTGILNGTTNYMLTRMAEAGAEFDDVLKEAQAMGYAEADPTADVEGQDACRKIAILSSIAYGGWINYEDIYTEGITKITPADMRYAEALGKAVKLLGTSHDTAEGISAMVAPFMVPAGNPLYSVNDVFNGILVHGNMLGDAMFYGSGAGKLPTASAVAGDVVEAASHSAQPEAGHFSEKMISLLPFDDMKNQFFLRIPNESLAEAKELFGAAEEVSIGLKGETGLLTGVLSEGECRSKIEKLGNIISLIRVKR